MFVACTPDQATLRNDFCDLILAWNKIIMPQGRKIRLQFFERSRATELINGAEIAAAFYWREFGEFDQTELDKAYGNLKESRNPRKIYTFFRNEDCNLISEEFRCFKESMSNDETYSHFFIGYITDDELRLKFLMQFELYLGSQESALETRDGNVVDKLTGERLVAIDSLMPMRKSEAYQAQKNFKAARPGAALVPTALRLPPGCNPLRLRRLSVGAEGQQRQ